MLNSLRKSLLATSAAIFLCAGNSLHAQQTVDSVGGRFATVFGAKIYYLDRGDGPIIVLIHGLGDQASIWKGTIDPLAKNHRVIALDVIGFGHSDKPPFDYRPQTFVDFLHGFITALHIEHASFVGNSLGGTIAALYASEHPEIVERLVMVDAGGYRFDPKTLSPRMAAALRLSTRDDYRYFAQFVFYDKKFYPTEAFLDYAMSERVRRGDGYTISKSIESLLRNDDTLDEHVASIQAPTLVLWGRGDRLVSLTTAQRLKRDIKGARLQIIEKCGHIPQVECPSDLNAALMQFIPGKGANQ